MKKVPFILAILLITVGAIQSAKAIDPTIRKHFPITAAVLAPAESEWHAGIVPGYFEHFSNPKNVNTFKPTYAAFIRGDKSVYHYFWYPEAQRELIKKRIQLIWGPKTDEEIVQIIETAEIRKIPDGVENDFAFFRLKKDMWEAVTRERYWKGRKLDDGRTIKFDELGLYQGQMLIVSLSCANLTYPLSPLGESDGPYKKPDPVIVTKEIIREVPVEKLVYVPVPDTTRPSATAIATATCNTCPPAAAPAPKPDDEVIDNHHHCTGSCREIQRDRKVWHETGGGKVLIAVIGGAAGGWAYERATRNRRVIVNGGGVGHPNTWPGQTGPVYGNTGQGQGGSWDTPVNTGGTTTGGTQYPNTWFRGQNSQGAIPVSTYSGGVSY